MSEYTFDVRITPRTGILDPQGKAVANALRSLDFLNIEEVRMGRLVRLRLGAASADAAREHVDAMCRQLLANPVTEDYDIELRGEG